VFAPHTPLDQSLAKASPDPQGKAETMKGIVRSLWHEDQGQDIAEYAVMLAVILVIVVGTIRLVGSNANNVFSSVASSVQ
jgi:Flp pilus assembly pilin Flp